MNSRQKRFCEELIINRGNVAEAARRAGYKESVAVGRAYSWVGKHRSTSKFPAMYDYVTERQEELENEYNVTKGKVLQGFHRIANMDPANLFDGDGRMKPITEMDEETRGAIVGIEFHELGGGVKKIRFADKNAAWAGIAKMLGYNTENKVDESETFLAFLKRSSARLGSNPHDSM
jgi:phage terminase small subunit